jgi:hypothetical protein
MSHGRDAYAEARARSQRALAPDQQKLSGGPGALAYVAAVRKLCRCGHAVLLHDINTKGIRSWCSYMDATGRCPCKKCELKNG